MQTLVTLLPHCRVPAGVSLPSLRTRPHLSRSRARLSGSAGAPAQLHRSRPSPERALKKSPAPAGAERAGSTARGQQKAWPEGSRRHGPRAAAAAGQPRRGGSLCPPGGGGGSCAASGARRVPPPALTPRVNEMLMPGRGAGRCPRP